jgi:two-component system nitrogen regulation response regulator NtrX
MSSLEVLIIDDELEIRSIISDILKDEGFSTRTAVNDKTTFAAIKNKIPDLIILDIWLEGSELDGLGILELIKAKHPWLPVVIISGHGNIELAVKAIKLGAYDFIEKPFSSDRLLITIRRATEAALLQKENIELRNKIIDKLELIGESSFTHQLKNEIDKVAMSNSRVFINGPVGSGKELIARLIHKKSKRCNSSFISFSPTGFNNEKIEQMLFGGYDDKDHDVSLNKKKCLLESADGGILYIDEIASLPLTSQTRLLNFLNDSTIEKINAKLVKVNVRIIVSTTKNLTNLVVQGKFREDLLYRLNVVPIVIPPLADRKDDIIALINYFIYQICKSSGLLKRKFALDAISALQSYAWPGNVRQLKNIIEWVLIMAPLNNKTSNEITLDMLPIEISRSLSKIKNHAEVDTDMLSLNLKGAREIFEKQYLIAQLNRLNGNISKTAIFVGMERSALHRKVKNLNILIE